MLSSPQLSSSLCLLTMYRVSASLTRVEAASLGDPHVRAEYGDLHQTDASSGLGWPDTSQLFSRSSVDRGAQEIVQVHKA